MEKGNDEYATVETNIRQVADVTQEDLETTDGEDVDLVVRLLELVGWSEVDRYKEKEKELP